MLRQSFLMRRLPVWGVLACVASWPAGAQVTETTPNPGTVSIVVGAPARDSRTIPAELFGSFLEPIGDSINHGLSAEILTNPSLESGLWNQANLEQMFDSQPELIRSSNAFNLPLPWEPLDPKAGRRFEVQYGDAANSWQSLEIMGVEGFQTGIVQQVYLPVHRTLTYKVSLYARHLEGPDRLTVLLRSHETGEVFAKAAITANSDTWTRYSATLTLTSGQLKPLQAVDFGVAVEPEERIDVDELSLMPSDAIDGFDPDVVAMASAMNSTELRFGGNFTSSYHWRDGIGPLDKRVTMQNLAWGIPEYNDFGTDEFLNFCKLIHAVPQFDLNMGSGTPLEAEAWVRYIRQHYDGKVVYELGNELWGRYQMGWVPVDQIAARTVAFSKAVRAVDPDAEIIATGERPQSFEKWNAELLNDPPGTYSDISTHFIRTTNQVALSDASPDFMAEAAYALPFAVGREFKQMQDQVNAIPALRDKVHFALTEWLFNSRGKGERVFNNASPNWGNEGGALMAAGMFNTMIRTNPDVSFADMTGILEFAGIWKRKEQVYGTPAYYTFRLYTSVKGDTILPVRTDSGQYGVRGAVQPSENMDGIPYVDVVAGLSPDRRILTLFCINRGLSKDTPVRFDLGWFHPEGQVEVQTVRAASRYEQNDETAPRRVVPEASSFPVAGSGAISYTLPPESVVELRFQHGGRYDSNTGRSLNILMAAHQTLKNGYSAGR